MPSEQRHTERSSSRERLIVLAMLLLVFFSGVRTVPAIPLTEYHSRIQQALLALDTLNQIDETESFSDYESRLADTSRRIQLTVPDHPTIEVYQLSVSADNSWLHQELERLEKATGTDRPELLARLTERLRAIEERLSEMEKSAAGTTSNKEAATRRLAAILARPEYAGSVKAETAFSRLWNRFLQWLQNLLPRPKPLSPGRFNVFGLLAQILVIVLALGVVAYVVRMFAIRLRGKRGRKERGKTGPRIVLGERLEPEQSALDLFSEAEALARRGDLRAAIRKGYIALLVELGERKIISLAQHKTNLDYLRAMREKPPLAENVTRLTDRFERHWYGLVAATDNDWQEFHAGYKETLLRAR
ncbi:MAG TPA: DUF4129 domain-containing protein [Pyrinomonadaceae bacterium]|nr:DUF4129 domain-containing protein [Pyrinomonadaceae bacterium]